MLKLAPNRKRVHTAVDSSGDEETSAKTELTVKEKEIRLIAVKKALPQCDTMVNGISEFCVCQVNHLDCNSFRYVKTSLPVMIGTWKWLSL